jgi:hypothetical protein
MQYVTKIQYKRRYLSQKGAIPNTLFQQSLPDVEWAGEFPTETEWTDTNFQEIPVTFNWDLNLSGTILNVVFKNETSNRVINKFKIDTSMFSTADGQTLWYIKDSVVNTNTPDDETADAQEHTVLEGDLINSYANTLPTKDFNTFGDATVIAFFVTKDNPSADDIIPVIIRPAVKADGEYWNNTPEIEYFNIDLAGTNYAEHTVTFTGNLTKHPLDPIIRLTFELMPEINVTSSAQTDDILTVNFDVTSDKVDFIYLVQDSGYLPKLKIPVTNGSGSFKVVTTGMNSGDLVRVKMGFKYWVNRNTFTKTL